MEITRGNLSALYTSYSALFQEGIKQIAPDWQDVAMEVPSSTLEEEYGWLGQLPNVREWIGPRVINALARYAYRIRNRDWEDTIEVDRNAILDDRFNIYGPRFRMLGQAISRAPNMLVYQTLKGGFLAPCYDGQYFFDADHPVLDVNGNITFVANTDPTPGAGPAWFLYDSTMKPLIFQNRQAFKLVAKDRDDDDNVFNLKKYLYGVDGRYNTGYGFWQFCWGSTQPLTAASYGAARDALMSMKGDYGAPIGVMPDTLAVPPNLEAAARTILVAERDAYGATNIWQGSAKSKVTPWLA